MHENLMKEKSISLSDDLRTLAGQPEFEREASFYALDSVQSIYDVTNSQFKDNAAERAKHIETLRVMHCVQLTELRGIHLYVNVRELNISSNSVLSMNGLESLRQVEDLNLSCNKISQIFSLQNMARSLKRLNLSHNRIVSLTPLGEIADQSPLQVLDLTDNYIGELSHVK